ncbi:MAG: histidine kinase [Gammaproteobacteria bacterium]|nr:histidine kinase [Gammaproteobacteria bacterium]MCW9004217.1 histidine kinase [Gammaproteobacteria bacterium]
MTNKPIPLLHSLRFRLIASVVTIEIIMLSILVWNNISIIHKTHTDRLRDTATSMLQQIANTSGRHMVAVDYATLEDYLSNILNYRELSYIIIVDRDNRPVIALGTTQPETRPEIDLHPNLVKDGLFDVAEDIKVANQFMGRVLMGFSLSLMDDAIHKSRSRGITIALIEITLTIIVTVLLGLGLTRRLSLLSNAAAEVEAGNYSVTIPTENDDEISKTATAFNRMVAEVDSRTQQLKEAEAQSRILLAENRQLIHTSLEVQEEERKHLARELHDELGQCLTAIQADAELIRDISHGRDKKIETSAVAIMNVSSRVYDVVHSMMHRLRPNILDNLGLVEALKDEIDAWQSRNTDTTCDLKYSGDLSRLDDRTNISLYRIIQECLTNISKHASARNVHIELSEVNENILLTIKDDGTGFDIHSPGRGLGLIGMRERVTSLQGKMEIETTPGTGFSITISAPLINKI